MCSIDFYAVYLSQLQGQSDLDNYEIVLFVLCLFNRSKMDQDHC